MSKLAVSDEVTKNLERRGLLSVEQEMRDVPQRQVHTERSNSIDSTTSVDHPPNVKNLDQQIRDFRKKLKSEPIYLRLESAFKMLAVRRKRPTKYLSLYNITEQSLMENFPKLFGFECQQLAKVMYIKMANRTNFAKVNFMKFADCFMGLLDERKDKRVRAIFDLLEFNGDGEYDLFYLFQLFINVPRETMFGQEMLALLTEYKDKNVFRRGTGGIQLNFTTFARVVSDPSLIDEFQYKLFGVYVPEKKPRDYTAA